VSALFVVMCWDFPNRGLFRLTHERRPIPVRKPRVFTTRGGAERYAGRLPSSIGASVEEIAPVAKESAR
jgi:hypothetical protein